jgi:hypothetical protein
MFSWLSNVFTEKAETSVEKWAVHNAKKATPDDLIAGAVVASFAKDYKHWEFKGEFHQRHSSSCVKSTSLSRKMVSKKDITIVFLFKKTCIYDDYSTVYKYKVIGCEVNGIRVTNAAFKYIYDNWQGITVKVRAAEAAAAEAKKRMEENEKKWDMAEGLLGMKRDGLGRLMPIKTADEPQVEAGK